MKSLAFIGFDNKKLIAGMVVCVYVCLHVGVCVCDELLVYFVNVLL